MQCVLVVCSMQCAVNACDVTVQVQLCRGDGTFPGAFTGEREGDAVGYVW